MALRRNGTTLVDAFHREDGVKQLTRLQDQYNGAMLAAMRQLTPDEIREPDLPNTASAEQLAQATAKIDKKLKG